MRKLKLVIMAVAAATLIVGAAEAGANRVVNGSLVEMSYYFEADGMPIVSKDKPENMAVAVGRKTHPEEFEKQLIGLKVGDNKTIKLRADQGFGAYRQELIYRVPKANLPANLNLKDGMLLAAKKGQRPVRVAKVEPDFVVLDQNHPLAGKKIVYHVQIKRID